MSLLVEPLRNSSCSIRHPGWGDVLGHGHLEVGQLVAIMHGGLKGRQVQTPAALGQSQRDDFSGFCKWSCLKPTRVFSQTWPRASSKPPKSPKSSRYQHTAGLASGQGRGGRGGWAEEQAFT